MEWVWKPGFETDIAGACYCNVLLTTEPGVKLIQGIVTDDDILLQSLTWKRQMSDVELKMAHSKGHFSGNLKSYMQPSEPLQTP